MKQSQIIIVEINGAIADVLRPLAQQMKCRLRELRNASGVLNVLHEGAQVVIIKVGRNLYEEMSLLEQLRWLFPDVQAIVLQSTDQPELAVLAWELGASIVLPPSYSRERLCELVAAMLE